MWRKTAVVSFIKVEPSNGLGMLAFSTFGCSEIVLGSLQYLNFGHLGVDNLVGSGAGVQLNVGRSSQKISWLVWAAARVHVDEERKSSLHRYAWSKVHPNIKTANPGIIKPWNQPPHFQNTPNNKKQRKKNQQN
eukprot:2987628-Amphidinium_carterae.1